MRERNILTLRQWTVILFVFAWLPSTSWAGGWYLMIAPPNTMEDVSGPDLSRPLKFWNQHKSFDSAKACEAARTRELASHVAKKCKEIRMREIASYATSRGIAAASVKPDEVLDAAMATAVAIDWEPGYLCIATDDPRLK
jgi:hypothetical protein